MIVIGITGQTGSGKSIASNVFKDRGIKVIDADKIARNVALPGTETYYSLKEAFGEDYFLSDGTLDRKKLGKTVFDNNEKLALLNSITLPAICSIIEDEITKELVCKTSKAVVIDAPLLKQAGLDKLCDVVIVITSSKEKRISRIIDRDAISYSSAENRILRQNDEGYYVENATKVFSNDNTADQLISDVNKYAEELGL